MPVRGEYFVIVSSRKSRSGTPQIHLLHGGDEAATITTAIRWSISCPDIAVSYER